MQSILRIKQRRSILLGVVNQSLKRITASSKMLRLCLMRRMLCMTAYLDRFSGWCTGHQAPLFFGEGPGVRFLHCATYTNLRTAVDRY